MSNAGGIGDFQSNSMVQIFEKNMRDIELRISRTKTNQQPYRDSQIQDTSRG